jgi:uncharacterized iron-regulated protein
MAAVAPARPLPFVTDGQIPNMFKVLLFGAVIVLGSGTAEACRGRTTNRLERLLDRLAVTDLQTSNSKLLNAVYATSTKSLETQRYTCNGWPLEFLGHELADVISKGGIVLLGEIHDNPAHHQIRALSLQKIVPDQTARPAVAFEQLTTDQQPALDRIWQRPPTTQITDEFLKAIDWASSGWAQNDYRPLFDAALSAKMPIYAGDVPKSIIRQAAKQGETAIAPAERARLKLDVPLPANQQDAILTELEASHCGVMPKTAFGGMAFAQRLRDATLADVALKAHAAHGSAIVMAGNGHVRGDRGIAWYVRQRAPEIKVVTVALVEVEGGKTDAAAYVPLDPDGKPAVDYVVFTPQHARPNPCDAFKAKP